MKLNTKNLDRHYQVHLQHLKEGLYDEIFRSQVVKFFFRQFPFNI